jgi:hypothetical protein
MKKKPTRKTVFICALGLLLMAVVGSVQAEPVLAITRGEFNFGYVPQHAEISHTFTLRNAGDDTLKITKVIPGCGCTKAPLEKDVLAPGESSNLEIIFSTRKYKGRISKSPKIVTNEGTAPKHVRIITNVTPRPDSTYPLVFKPYKIDFSQFGKKKRDRMKVTIRNVSERDLDLELIAFPYELAEIDLPEKVKAGSSVEAELVLKAENLDTEFGKSFTIQVNDDELTRFTVPVKRSTRVKQARVAPISDKAVSKNK